MSLFPESDAHAGAVRRQMMRTISSIKEMQALAEVLRREGRRIGFVPTMGYLHEGHLSLMQKAREECDIVVVSVFVNPTQFGPSEDFDRYPRDPDGDSMKCESAGADILFMPEREDMYPGGPAVYVMVEGVSDILEGAVRPGHFRGVATVVCKLFNIVKPHRAYFGQKDFQQCVIIKRMVAGLDMDVEVVVMPTIREPDGLAMSSRNVYLSPEERIAARALYRALRRGEGLIRSGTKDAAKIKQEMAAVILDEKGTTIDYIEIADPETLSPLHTASDRMVLLVAVRINKTRLIDNLLIL